MRPTRNNTIATIAVTAALTLGACGPSQPYDPGRPAKALPASFYNEITASSIADSIADECRQLSYNRRYENAVVEVYGQDLLEQGYTEFDIDVGLDNWSEADIQDRMLSWVDRRDVVFADANTWCKAGVAEIAEDTRIGKYLYRK